MYDYIKGLYTYRISTNKGCFVTVEANGIGYNLEIMERDFIDLPKEYNQEIKIYTVLLHREDKMSLCGFLKREYRDIFNILTSVSGVGSKMALTLLNSFEVSELVGVVLDEDYKALTKAKGVGPKLAQKIILELKDKLTSYKEIIPTKAVSTSGYVNSQNVEDAQLVLLSLGYSKEEISSAMSDVNTEQSAEEILKQALTHLAI